MGRSGISRRSSRVSLATAGSIVLWSLVTACLAVALIRTSDLPAPFPLVVLLAYTPYFLPIALLCAVGALLARRPLPALLALGAAVLIAAAVVPRMAADDSAPPSTLEVRMMALNLDGGAADSEDVVRLIADERPELVAFSELTPGAVQALDAAGIATYLHRRVVSPGAGADGSGLFSVFSLRRLPGIAPAIGSVPMTRALVRTPPARFEAVAVHVLAPTSPTATKRWSAGLRALPSCGPEPASILLGDFNATLDHAQLRDVIGHGCLDAADAAGSGLKPTWPLLGSWSPPVTIDHVLAPLSSAVSEYRTAEVSGTDHAAVLVTLGLPG